MLNCPCSVSLMPDRSNVKQKGHVQGECPVRVRCMVCNCARPWLLLCSCGVFRGVMHVGVTLTQQGMVSGGRREGRQGRGFKTDACALQPATGYHMHVSVRMACMLLLLCMGSMHGPACIGVHAWACMHGPACMGPACMACMHQPRHGLHAWALCMACMHQSACTCLHAHACMHMPACMCLRAWTSCTACPHAFPLCMCPHARTSTFHVAPCTMLVWTGLCWQLRLRARS